MQKFKQNFYVIKPIKKTEFRFFSFMFSFKSLGFDLDFCAAEGVLLS